ncbi:hypothetical protein [Delftia tsuruhatensis]|uniref:hypothetical protein n=1 Tax=Delftia tsuruhatensis TaxID=180282 RepID=UPI00370AF397
MDRYSNRGGDSGITGYEIAQGQIIVQFRDGSKYLYNSQSPGSAVVAEMQRLAVAGEGLNSYISRVVRKNFAQKLS